MKLSDYIVPVGTSLTARESCAPSKNRAIQVCLKRSKRGRLIEKTVNDKDSACEALRFLSTRDRENFVVMHLGPQKQVLGIEEVARGTVQEVSVHPREVFKGAILSNASSVIVAHNHPSGDASPSDSDYQISERLVQAGRILNIPVLDHVVVGASECVTLRERKPEIFE